MDLLASVVTFTSLTGALAASHPVSSYPSPLHVPILRYGNVSNRVAKLPTTVEAIERRYGSVTTNGKRSGRTSSGYIPLTDELGDVCYSGVMSIGTPSKNFNVILDTGSSDLWVTTTACTTCTSDVPLFDPSKSSTYLNATSIVEIEYGSGAVTGYVSEDTVTFGGFTQKNQRFLAVDTTTTGMLKNSLSGIMGLGFQSISALQTPPFWQALYDQNLLSQPVFGFYLERHVNDSDNSDTSPGGTLTLGGTNSSLYAGNIEFINMPNGITPGYWFQQVQSVTIQGISINVPSDSSLAAIDTGTSLIGAPMSISQQIWATVPGSMPLTGAYQGMYAFPCTTDITVSISFGGTNWTISAADMNFGTIDDMISDSSDQMCVGGIFDMSDGGRTAWVIGDVFLKNVYSVFQADPPAVGFAQLVVGLEDSASSGGLSTSGSRVASSIPSLMSLSLVVSLLAWFSILT